MKAFIGPQIDWKTAEIEGTKLSVALVGEIPKGWAKHFNGVISLLGQSSNGWGEIAIHKGTITVADIQEESEADLRHFLESTLLQANAGSAPPPSRDGNAHSDQERAMTETFRNFGSVPDSQ